MCSFKTLALVLAAFTSSLLAGAAAQATVLTFDPVMNEVAISQDYGDRVVSTSQGGFGYLLTGGATPNVTVSYSGGATSWDSNYGDLTNIAFSATQEIFQITLQADPGFLVSLSSFDMAGWSNTDRIVSAVAVMNEVSTVLFASTNALIQGDFVGPRHTDFDFATPLTGSMLRIVFDSRNLGSQSYNVGIDNVQFSQSVIPEPGTSALLAASLCALGFVRRKVRA